MAQIIITFDTVEKTCTATMEGADVSDFRGAEVYRDYYERGDPKFHVRLLTTKEDDANKTRTETWVTASADGLVPDVKAAMLKRLRS